MDTNLMRDYLSLQRAYLLQQRELNVLQMEKVERLISENEARAPEDQAGSR